MIEVLEMKEQWDLPYHGNKAISDKKALFMVLLSCAFAVGLLVFFIMWGGLCNG